MAPVKAMFATGYEDELIRRNPCATVRLPNRNSGLVEDDEEQAKAISRVERADFLAAVEPRWQVFFRLLAATGV